MDCSGKVVRDTVQSLGLKSYIYLHRQLLTESAWMKRLEWSKKLITWLKHNLSTVRIFSDKKVFKINQVCDSQNDCYLASSVQEVPAINAAKFHASVMILGMVGSDSKRMPPVWFPKGMKVGTPEYLNVLETKLKPWLEVSHRGGNYVFQQDGAPSHIVRKTQKWLGEFQGSALWPPSSPDLNPLDFGTWGVVEKRACKTSHPNLEALKAAINKEWEDMTEDLVQKVCSRFWPHLKVCITAEGVPFED